ncbi:MAG TPA: antibiotic biosynthesis monooxygenase family protein [Stellaceae bacterium]|nr:antibiotic biosynthesis monooxygenase family protein [Stellaceae bacterium]
MAGHVITVDFQLKPESLDQFLELIRENAALSLKTEKGCRRFDVCVPPDGSPRVFLYEIYDDEVAFKAHLEMPHYKSFATASATMVENRKIAPLKLL